ncbi:hypothetical protein Tco_0919346 [Tanacetum coccineum]
MSTLAEFMILFGGDNRPPMLEKHLYDSWKSIMELYMQNKDHERMILESVEHGLLIWPTIEEKVVYGQRIEELSQLRKFKRLVAKDLWERVQLLMQGTSLTKHERECKLYDAFDKFAHIKGESLHQYYLIFTQLINDMNNYKMKLEQFQVNIKFLNSLPLQIMAPTTRRGPNTPVNNTNPNNMTSESIQAMIDQALLRNFTNGDGSHSSHEDNRRNVQTARPSKAVLMANLSSYGSDVLSERIR